MKSKTFQKIRRIREELNISHENFAAMFGLTLVQYRNIEWGNEDISPIIKKLEPNEAEHNIANAIARFILNTRKERLTSVINLLGYETFQGVIKRMDISKKHFDEIYVSEDWPDKVFLEYFLNVFPQVSRDWLLYFKGSMHVDGHFLNDSGVRLGEIAMENYKIIEEKNREISNLHRQVDLLQSFIPATKGSWGI